MSARLEALESPLASAETTVRRAPSRGTGSRHQHSPRESPGPAAGHPKKETRFHTTSLETEIETKIGPSEEVPSTQRPRDGRLSAPSPPHTPHLPLSVHQCSGLLSDLTVSLSHW